jgi:hypothetical protein
VDGVRGRISRGVLPIGQTYRRSFQSSSRSTKLLREFAYVPTLRRRESAYVHADRPDTRPSEQAERNRERRRRSQQLQLQPVSTELGHAWTPPTPTPPSCEDSVPLTHPGICATTWSPTTALPSPFQYGNDDHDYTAAINPTASTLAADSSTAAAMYPDTSARVAVSISGAVASRLGGEQSRSKR